MMTLRKKLKGLEDRLQQQERMIAFLSNHNRDDVIIEASYDGIGILTQVITYIYQGQLHRIPISFLERRDLKIQDNLADQVILTSAVVGGRDTLILDKASESIAPVTEQVLGALQEMGEKKKEMTTVKLGENPTTTIRAGKGCH